MEKIAIIDPSKSTNLAALNTAMTRLRGAFQSASVETTFLRATHVDFTSDDMKVSTHLVEYFLVPMRLPPGHI